MILCEYGCGKQATHQFKNGKRCCSTNIAKCPKNRQNNSIKLLGRKKSKIHRQHISESSKGKVPWNKGKKTGLVPWNKGLTKETDERVASYAKKQSVSKMGIGKGRSLKTKGKTYEEIYGKEEAIRLKEIRRQKMLGNDGNKLTIKKINKKYPLFSSIEEMRYNPDKPIKEKEIQVHCKNHECRNSKEKGGWFTPTKQQLNERFRQLEHSSGNDGSYLYCSDECKSICPLYNLHSDPFKDKSEPYTDFEIQTWRKQVKELDNSKCQICETTENIHVHHIIPKKLEPFFALDPDNGICLCKECHYKYGHVGECSYGNLKNKRCEVIE